MWPVTSSKLGEPRDIPRAYLAHHRGHGESEEERLRTRLTASCLHSVVWDRPLPTFPTASNSLADFM